MVEKVYISAESTATFICPKCSRSRTQDLSLYLEVDHEIKAKIRCKCGHRFETTVDRRKYYRKTTNLVGVYLIDEKGITGQMTVKDISRGGLKFHVHTQPAFKIGARILVEFRLDDRLKTSVSKSVIVKKITDGYVGAQFVSIDPTSAIDKAIGFFLLQ
jgi:hypothetical protein